MKKLQAFSLAEVMIAMAVIGLVAALVMPNRITGAQTKANNIIFKSTFNQLQQGLITAANVRKHEFVKVGENASNKTKTVEQLSAYLKDHFNISNSNRNIANDELEDERYAVYTLKSGAQLIFTEDNIETMKAHGCSESHPCVFYIDVNGNKVPNRIVTCITGTTSNNITEPCTVSENNSDDIFPVIIKNMHIYPATNAVNYVLSK